MVDYQVSTTNVEIELESPTLVNLVKFSGTWKILWGSCQDQCGNGFTMYFVVVYVCFV